MKDRRRQRGRKKETRPLLSAILLALIAHLITINETSTSWRKEELGGDWDEGWGEGHREDKGRGGDRDRDGDGSEESLCGGCNRFGSLGHPVQPARIVLVFVSALISFVYCLLSTERNSYPFWSFETAFHNKTYCFLFPHDFSQCSADSPFDFSICVSVSHLVSRVSCLRRRRPKNHRAWWPKPENQADVPRFFLPQSTVLSPSPSPSSSSIAFSQGAEANVDMLAASRDWTLDMDTDMDMDPYPDPWLHGPQDWTGLGRTGRGRSRKAKAKQSKDLRHSRRWAVCLSFCRLAT